MAEQLGWHGQPVALSSVDGFAEAAGVPADDDGGEEIQARDSVVLTLGGAITGLALAAGPQGVLQRVMGLALVEAELRAALHVGIERPVDHEQRTLDATDLAQRRGEIVATRKCRQLEDAGPVVADQPFPHAAADHGSQLRWTRSGLEYVHPLRRQVPDAGHEPIPEDGGGGEDVLGEASGIGVLLADAAASLVEQQAIEDVGRLTHRGRDGVVSRVVTPRVSRWRRRGRAGPRTAGRHGWSAELAPDSDVILVVLAWRPPRQGDDRGQAASQAPGGGDSPCQERRRT